MRNQYLPCFDQRGFSLTVLLILIPVITLSYFSIALSSVLMSVKRQNELKCERTTLNAQDEQAQLLRQLLNLNPPARTLRKQRKTAERAVRIAEKTGNIKAYLAAKLALEMTKAKQAALIAKQEAILANSQFAWKKSQIQLRALIGSNSERFQFLYPTGLPVLLEGAASGSPTYRVKANSESFQTSQFSWVSIVEDQQNIFKRLTGKTRATVPIKCSGTLKKVRSKWVAVLNQVKS